MRGEWKRREGTHSSMAFRFTRIFSTSVHLACSRSASSLAACSFASSACASCCCCCCCCCSREAGLEPSMALAVVLAMASTKGLLLGGWTADWGTGTSWCRWWWVRWAWCGMWWRGLTGWVEERGGEAKDAVVGWVGGWGRGVVGRDIVVVW